MKQKIKLIIRKIADLSITYYKISSLLLGCLLAAALPPYYISFLALLSFSWILYISAHFDKKSSLSAIGYWFGFGYFMVGFSWIGNALLVDVEKTGVIYPFVLLLNGAFFGLFTIPPFLFTRYGKGIFVKILFFASAWVICTEWLRSFILTGFPWNPISSFLAISPDFLQTLAWWGTYGLSLIIIIALSLPAIWFMDNSLKKVWAICVSFLIPMLLWCYGEYTINSAEYVSYGDAIMVRLVQPSIPQSLKWSKETIEDNFNKYIELSKKDGNEHLDFVIWGETASPFDFIHDVKHREKVRKAVPKKGYLISGFLRRDYEDDSFVPYNSFAVINRKTEVVDYYDKNHLVPFGEYIPFRKYLPDWVRPIANNVAEFGRGEKYKTISVEGYPEFAPLICYEIIFSDEVVKKENKPKWMIVLTNDGWYGISSGPYQHLVAAQMRAVEEGISVVRGANSGISAVINPYGQIVDKLPLAEAGYIDVPVRIDLARKTLFGRYGNIIPIGMSLLVLSIAIFLARKNVKV